MSDREKQLVKYQKQYRYLVNKISKLQLSGENPPEELLKKAREIGRRGRIPEAFFKTF